MTILLTCIIRQLVLLKIKLQFFLLPKPLLHFVFFRCLLIGMWWVVRSAEQFSWIVLQFCPLRARNRTRVGQGQPADLEMATFESIHGSRSSDWFANMLLGFSFSSCSTVSR